jgi:NarL family two-component system response regulator LiaR
VIRVLIVDDHAIVRKGIRALLSESGGFEIIAEVADGQAAVLIAQETAPDVILMDLLMPGMDGIEATRRITAVSRMHASWCLTSFAADNKLFPAIKAGALGYLLKDSSPEELVRAVRQVHRGEPALTSDHRPQASAGDRSAC